MVVSNSPEADEIQRQMQSVRSSLRQEVKELVENARDMTDWQYYVRRYPWAALAVAAGVGFIITPAMMRRREEAPATSREPIRLAASPPPRQPSLTGRLASHLFSAASGAISRAAMSVISQQLSSLVSGERHTKSDIAKHGDRQHVESNY